MAPTSRTTTATDPGWPRMSAIPGWPPCAGRRIAWAQRAMPVLGLLRAAFAEQQPFTGLAVAACLHVTAETAGLVSLITAGGGAIHLAASNPLSTQDDVAAALAAEPGVTVYARSGADRGTYTSTFTAPSTAGPIWSSMTAAIWSTRCTSSGRNC